MSENRLEELAGEYISLRNALAEKEMAFMSKMGLLTGNKKKKSEIMRLLNMQSSELDKQIEKLKGEELTLDMKLSEHGYSRGDA